MSCSLMTVHHIKTGMEPTSEVSYMLMYLDNGQCSSYFSFSCNIFGLCLGVAQFESWPSWLRIFVVSQFLCGS